VHGLVNGPGLVDFRPDLVTAGGELLTLFRGQVEAFFESTQPLVDILEKIENVFRDEIALALCRRGNHLDQTLTLLENHGRRPFRGR